MAAKFLSWAGLTVPKWIMKAGPEMSLQERSKEPAMQNGKYYFIPNASIGLPTSTYEGVYDVITQEIDKYSREVFG